MLGVGGSDCRQAGSAKKEKKAKKDKEGKEKKDKDKKLKRDRARSTKSVILTVPVGRDRDLEAAVEEKKKEVAKNLADLESYVKSEQRKRCAPAHWHCARDLCSHVPAASAPLHAAARSAM